MRAVALRNLKYKCDFLAAGARTKDGAHATTAHR